MAAVHVARALRRRREELEKENGKENEDPEEKKARKGKAGVALEAAAAPRILVSIRRGKLVFPLPIGMLKENKTKGECMLVTFLMEMIMKWLASLIKCWRQKQFINNKNRKRKLKQKNAGVGL